MINSRLYNWPPNSDLLLNKSLLELNYFLNESICSSGYKYSCKTDPRVQERQEI